MRSIGIRSLFMAVGLLPLGSAEARAAALAAPAESFTDVLRQTAAVIEGDVQDVSFRYDDVEGPRTVATMVDIVVHMGSLGSSPPRTLELRSFGGFLPDGREVIAMHVPAFSAGKRHVVFLRNTDWVLSPVAFGFVFRVEHQDTKAVIVDPFGRLVVDVDVSGSVSGAALWDRSNGALDALASAAKPRDLTEGELDRALDVAEFVDHVRAFATARGVWPSGTFSMTPGVPNRAWQFVATTAQRASDEFGTTSAQQSREDELLACFGPVEEAQDTTPLGGEACSVGGAP